MKVWTIIRHAGRRDSYWRTVARGESEAGMREVFAELTSQVKRGELRLRNPASQTVESWEAPRKSRQRAERRSGQESER